MVCNTECKSGLNIAAAANMGRLHSEAWDRELLRVRSEAGPPPPGAALAQAGSESQLEVHCSAAAGTTCSALQTAEPSNNLNTRTRGQRTTVATPKVL